MGSNVEKPYKSKTNKSLLDTNISRTRLKTKIRIEKIEEWVGPRRDHGLKDFWKKLEYELRGSESQEESCQ